MFLFISMYRGWRYYDMIPILRSVLSSYIFLLPEQAVGEMLCLSFHLKFRRLAPKVPKATPFKAVLRSVELLGKPPTFC